MISPVPGDNLVNLAKTVKKLRREAVANPKKAALLGLVTILALYYWAPLLKGWIAADTTTVETTTSPAAVATVAVQPSTAAPVAATTATAKPVAPRLSWQQITERMSKDPRTMIAPALTQTRDPFEAQHDEEAEAPAKEKRRPSRRSSRRPRPDWY